jgi:Ferritin-like domain
MTNDNSKGLNRRAALGNIGKFGVGAVAASVLAGSLSGAQTMQPAMKKNVDVAVLNFALNLEYLEAAFYLAAVGRLAELRVLGGNAEIILPAGLNPQTGMTFQDKNVEAYVREIAGDELAHVRFLRAALGKAAIDRPVLDLGPAFDAAGQAASGGALKGFNPYAADLFFLHGAFIFEDVGVTAYKGAAPLLTNPQVLEAAAGILAAEAYHAGQVRTLLYAQKDVVAAAGLTVAQITGAISALRAKVGGGKDQGLTKGKTEANIIPLDQNGIAYSRTTREVLNIVYLGGTKMGGFFPAGLNGAIK